MTTEREMLHELLRRSRTTERLLLLVLRGEREIIMNEEAVLALLDSVDVLIQTLESNTTVDHLQDPEVQAALTRVKADVDAATPPAPVPGDGSVTVADAS